MKQTVKELEDFFKDREYPNEVNMAPHGKITDVNKFVNSHLIIIKAQSGNRRYMPYYQRLVNLKKKLE